MVDFRGRVWQKAIGANRSTAPRPYQALVTRILTTIIGTEKLKIIKRLAIIHDITESILTPSQIFLVVKVSRRQDPEPWFEGKKRNQNGGFPRQLFFKIYFYFTEAYPLLKR